MIQLADGAYCWSAFNAEKKFNFNGHILRTAEGTVIVDPVAFSADDLSVIEAADRAGIPASIWYAIEAGRKVTVNRLPAIAVALGCKPSQLLP